MSRSAQPASLNRGERGVFDPIVLILVVLLLVAVGVIFYFVGNGAISIPGISKQTATKVEPQVQYENPFDEKTQYTNPFEEYQNPFDSLE